MKKLLTLAFLAMFCWQGNLFATTSLTKSSKQSNLLQEPQRPRRPHMPKDSSEVKKGPQADGQKGKGPAAKKPNEYETLLKKGGSYEKGVFNVRHIEKKWYFEISDDMLDRMFLAVSRYVSVPQNFDKFPGEEISDHAIYFRSTTTRPSSCVPIPRVRWLPTVMTSPPSLTVLPITQSSRSLT